MNYLKQSTTITIQLGPFLDEDDGKTAETALTVSSTDVWLSKGGAVFANPNDANAAAHDRVGWYRKQINATDTGTLGRLIVSVHEAGALPVWREFMVIPANVYDSLVAGTDDLDVQVEGIATTVKESIADTVLIRSASFVEATAGDHTLAALILATLESNTVGTAWTIYKTDGVTVFLAKTLALDPAASPVIGVS